MLWRRQGAVQHSALHSGGGVGAGKRWAAWQRPGDALGEARYEPSGLRSLLGRHDVSTEKNTSRKIIVQIENEFPQYNKKNLKLLDKKFQNLSCPELGENSPGNYFSMYKNSDWPKGTNRAESVGRAKP